MNKGDQIMPQTRHFFYVFAYKTIEGKADTEYIPALSSDSAIYQFGLIMKKKNIQGYDIIRITEYERTGIIYHGQTH